MDFCILDFQKWWFALPACFKGNSHKWTLPNMMGLRRSLSLIRQLIWFCPSGQETFINSRPQDPEELVNQLRVGIQQRLGNWRSWSSYVQKLDVPESIFQRVVFAGSGLLSYAPSSITSIITKVCQTNGIATWSTAGDYEVIQNRLLFIGSNYVIAQAFIQHKD